MYIYPFRVVRDRKQSVPLDKMYESKELSEESIFLFLFDHYPRKHTTGSNALPSCGEKIFVIPIRTDAAQLDMRRLYTEIQELHPVGFP